MSTGGRKRKFVTESLLGWKNNHLSSGYSGYSYFHFYEKYTEEKDSE